MDRPLAPSGKLDVSAAAALHDSLRAARGRDLTLDLGRVTQIGALCLQLCLAAARAARADGHKMRIIDTSDTVAAQMHSMGFSPETLAEGAP